MAITINGSGITSANIADGTITASDISASEVKNLKSGRKNLIINGGFDVSQRGNYTSATTVTNDTLYLDRWTVRMTSVTATIQQLVSDYPYTDSKSSKLVATSTASGVLRHLQRVEGRLTGRELTLSAWVKSNSSDARIFCYKSGTTERVASSPHTGGGAWEKLTVTYTDNATTQNNLYFDLALASSTFSNVTITSGDYIEITQVQLELGSVATDFEHRSYGEELALCQRYYQVLNFSSYGPLDGYYGSGNYMHWCSVRPVRMRADPASTITYGTGSNLMSNPYIHPGDNAENCWVAARANATGRAYAVFTKYIADAEL